MAPSKGSNGDRKSSRDRHDSSVIIGSSFSSPITVECTYPRFHGRPRFASTIAVFVSTLLNREACLRNRCALICQQHRNGRNYLSLATLHWWPVYAAILVQDRPGACVATSFRRQLHGFAY